MRVVCDSCGATYKIPDTKLVKDVNRATCRKCGHRMLIRKPDGPGGMAGYPAGPATEEERTVIASAVDLEQARARAPGGRAGRDRDASRQRVRRTQRKTRRS